MSWIRLLKETTTNQ